MNVLPTLIACVGLATALAAATVLSLRASLRKVAVEACSSESHGSFWVAFSNICIVLTTMLGTLLVIRTDRLAAWDDRASLGSIVECFRAGLLGLMLSLAAMALVLLVSISLRPPKPA